MQKRVDQIVLEILTAIDYPHNKEKYVKEFLELNHTEAMLNMLERLPNEIQDKIKAIKVETEVAEEIKKHIKQEDYIEELTKVSMDALQRFIQSLSPTLNPSQKENILKIIQVN